jgi:enoyl-CoA hydratase/carnithine racemase
MPTVTYERIAHLGHVRLNRPEKQNQFTLEMMAGLGRIFTEAEDDPEVRCLLLTANGDDFSTGADVADVVPAWARAKNPIEPHHINPWGLGDRKRAIPLVMVVQGRCINAGLELALASDVCIAADNARFAFEEIRFGTYPFAGGLFRFIRAAGRSSAMRYALTGDHFDANEAFRMNLVSSVEPLAKAQSVGREIATRISEAAPLALRAALGQVQAWADGGDAAAFARSIPDIVRLVNTQDSAEAIRARMEGRAPVFVGR